MKNTVVGRMCSLSLVLCLSMTSSGFLVVLSANAEDNGTRFYKWMGAQTEFPIGAWCYVSGQTQNQAWFDTYKAANLNVIQANVNQLVYTKAAGLNVAVGTWDNYMWDYNDYDPSKTAALTNAIALANNPSNRITIFLIKDDLPAYKAPYTSYYSQYDALNHIINAHIYPNTPSNVMVQTDFLPIWSELGQPYWPLMDTILSNVNSSAIAHCNYPVLRDPLPQGSTSTNYFEQLEGFRDRTRGGLGDPAKSPGLFALVSLVSYSGGSYPNRQASVSDARWQVFCQLAYGAKGLWWYNYQRKPSGMEAFGDGYVDINGNKTTLYAMCSNINYKVRNWGMVLKNPNLTPTAVSFIPNSQSGPPAGVDTYQYGDAGGYFDVISADGGVCISKFDFAWDSDWHYVMVVNMQHGGDYYNQNNFTRTVTCRFAKRLLTKGYVNDDNGVITSLNLPSAIKNWYTVNFTIPGGDARLFALKKRGEKVWLNFEDLTVADRSGYDHPTTINGGYYSTIREEGEYSYYFNGSNAYAEVADHSDIDIGTTDFGISLRFRRDANSAGNLRILSKGAVSDTDKGYCIWSSDNSVTFALCDGTNRLTVSGAHLGTNVWNKLAVNIDRSANMVLYVNGTNVAQTDISGWLNKDLSNTRNLDVGRAPGCAYFEGRLDDVALFKRVLSQEEIAP